jgi:hypothetical protein
LDHFEVGWVLLHRLESADEQKYRPYLDRLLGPAVVEDETLIAYRVPRRDRSPGRPPESSFLYTIGEHGWRRPEEDGGLWRRWLQEDGQLYLYSNRDVVGALRFNVDSHLDFPLLEVYQENRLRDTFVVEGRTSYATQPITLTKGMNVFRFRAPGGCPQVLDDARCWRDALLTPPDDSLPICDARTTCRTFVFDDIAFLAQDDPGRRQSASIDFGSQMRLRHWDIETPTLNPGDDLKVRLTWEALAKLNERYVVFVHLLSPDGDLVAQNDSAPLGRLLPSATWPVGATYGYPVILETPDDLPAGQYDVQVGVYLWPGMERLTVPSSADNVIPLGAVEVVP